MLALTGEDGFTIRAPSRPAATGPDQWQRTYGLVTQHRDASSAGRSRWRPARPAPRSASRTSVTDPRGNRTDFCYDVNYAGAAIAGSRGNLARTIGPPPASSANRPVTLLAYDAKNNVTQAVAPKGVPSGATVTCATNLSASRRPMPPTSPTTPRAPASCPAQPPDLAAHGVSSSGLLRNIVWHPSRSGRRVDCHVVWRQPDLYVLGSEAYSGAVIGLGGVPFQEEVTGAAADRRAGEAGP